MSPIIVWLIHHNKSSNQHNTLIRRYGKEAESLLTDLQSRNERMFLVTIILSTFGDSKRQLGDNVFQSAGIALKYNCKLEPLDYQQEQGLVSSLPIGVNKVPIERGLTTSALAIFVPFTTRELFQGGEALYYGLNALSNNMIMCDRKTLKNPNGLYHKGTQSNHSKQAVTPFAAHLGEWGNKKGAQILLYQQLKKGSIQCRHQQSVGLIAVRTSLCA